MSIPVEITELEAAMREYGSGYLVTTGEDLRPHIAQLMFTMEAGLLVCSAGRRSCANGGINADVALVWPPLEPGGYSLIADGRVAELPAGDGGGRLTITPLKAVLHRPAPAAVRDDDAKEPGACLSDCAPVAVADHPA
jgi:hypothetical protein